MKKIILASASPRRKLLLSLADIDFETEPSNITEEFDDNLPPESIVRNIAVRKARAVFEKKDARDNIIIIGADTSVIAENKILNKPADFNEAFDMLKTLSGKTHLVITGVCILSLETELSFTETTEVAFNHLSDDQITYYVKKYTPFDKAGGYAIQEWIGAVGIKSIKGDYYNVMGLPVNKLLKKLNGLGVKLPGF